MSSGSPPTVPAVFSWRRAERLLRSLIVALTAFFLLIFLYAAARRLHYPFELEWIESGMLTSVLRIVHGQDLYVAPTLHFVPFLYAPVYLYAAAALTRITGLGASDYTALRLISIAGSLGTAGLIFAFVRHETRTTVAAYAAAGLYLASYALLGTFFDIGRVDALFVFFIVAALLLQRLGYPVLAAALWVVAFQTKQSVLPLAVVVLLSHWQRPKQCALGVAVFLLGAVASVALLNHFTAGWYSFYIFHVTRGLGLLWRQAALYWPSVVLEPFQIAWALIAAAVLLVPLNWRSPRVSFYALSSLSLFGGVWIVESHRGASANAAMPIVAWIAMLFGVALGRLLGRAEATAHAQRWVVLTLFAAAAQLFALTYNPGGYIPPPAAYAEGNALLQTLRALPGEVYVLNHGHDAVLAGKPSYAEGEALGAVIDAQIGGISADLRRQFQERLQQHRYSAVVIDDVEPTHTSWHVDPYYPMAWSAPAQASRYLTSQPKWFLFPCTGNPGAQQAVKRANSIVFYGSCGDKQ